MNPKNVAFMEYLRWAKTHRRVRYELTASGAPFVRPEELGATEWAADLEVKGTYGDPELVTRIARRYGVTEDRVLPVPGTSSANFIAIAVAAQQGGRILVERPTYDPFLRIASFLNLNVVPLERRPIDEFDVRLADLQRAIESGVEVVVLTNLHNPSGRLLPAEAIGKMASLCVGAGTLLILDEAYLDGAYLTGRNPLWTAAMLSDRIIVTNSLTKVYGLPGLRVGWLLASPEVIECARPIMDILSVDNAAPSASLALHALDRMPRLEERYRHAYEEGRSVFRRWLAEEPLVGSYPSFGALFECLQLPQGLDADRFNDVLVTAYDTQVVPGRFFGVNDHIRVSIAVPPSDLKEGLSRISQALRQCSGRTRAG